MLSKEVVELSKQHSIIRDIFEYGMKRAKEVGAENVFDFSIGNPSVPAPKEIDETALRLLKTADPVDIHGYTSNAGVLEVRENIAKSLNKRFDTNYTAANIFMTIGAAYRDCDHKVWRSSGQYVIKRWSSGRISMCK